MKRKYRGYASIRNYADNKMIRVEHALPNEDIDDIVYEMQYETDGKFTYNSSYFFFEDDTDALLFRLRHGK